MTNLATELDATTAVEEVGTVQRIGEAIVVLTGSGRYAAKRAISCLVEPVLDDTVLLATAADGRSWVLAVLEREATGVVLSVDGDLELRPRAGRVAIKSTEGVSIASGGDVSVAAKSVDVNALDGRVVFQRLSYLGRLVRSEVEKVKVFAGTFDAVMDRFSQQVKRSYRRVEELDQLRAESIDHTADKTMNLQAKNTLVSAEQLVKVNGDQIHLG